MRQLAQARSTWLYRGFAVFLVVVAFSGLALAHTDDVASTSKISAPPAEDYQKVSDLVPLPEFIPGLGTLYVQPATLPVGPFLGYDRAGKLVHITYMVPLSDFTESKNLIGLETIESGIEIDHVDITYNPGHPGVEVPHYHITLWTIGAEEASRLE